MSKACEKAFIQLLEQCAIEIPSLGRQKIVPVKPKRMMSGYNCFTKNLYAAEKKSAEAENRDHISFRELIKMKTWGTIPPKQKNIWKDLAKQGCPTITDPLNV